jgi:hypothetical protein
MKIYVDPPRLSFFSSVHWWDSGLDWLSRRRNRSPSLAPAMYLAQFRLGCIYFEQRQTVAFFTRMLLGSRDKYGEMAELRIQYGTYHPGTVVPFMPENSAPSAKYLELHTSSSQCAVPLTGCITCWVGKRSLRFPLSDIFEAVQGDTDRVD